jgi:hypothetical protein
MGMPSCAYQNEMPPLTVLLVMMSLLLCVSACGGRVRT